MTNLTIGDMVRVKATGVVMEVLGRHEIEGETFWGLAERHKDAPIVVARRSEVVKVRLECTWEVDE